MLLSFYETHKDDGDRGRKSGRGDGGRGRGRGRGGGRGGNESVQVQWTHQIFQSHSCPDSVSSNNIIFYEALGFPDLKHRVHEQSLLRCQQIGALTGFNSLWHQ